MSEQNELITGIEEIEDTPMTATEVVANTERALARHEDATPTDRLIMMAVQGAVDVTVLEKLIALKNAEEERAAKKEFDRQFALMQAKLPTIKKAKPVKDNDGKLLYYYAPLEDIQTKCDPVIAKHRFGYRWKETALDKGKRITIVISGHGHSEETTFDVPEGQTNKVANQVQAQGSMTTFGHRYTYVAGFGITVEGQDDDGSFSFDDGVTYSKYFKAMDAETDVKALYEIEVGFIKDLREQRDYEGAEKIKKYYAKRKKELA